MKNRYFSIFDGVCLLMENETATTLEWRLLRRDGTWVDGKDTALDHLFRGESGCKEITRTEAEALARKLGGTIP